MFAWWARVIIRRRRWVLAGALAFVAVGVAWGTSVFGSLVNGGFDDPKSESSQAQQLIDDRIGGVTTDVVVLFRNPAVTVEDPAYRTMVDTAMQQFPVGAATAVHTYWDTRSPTLVSTDRHVTFVAVSLKDRNEIIKTTAYDPLRDSVKGTGYTVQIGGTGGVNSDISDRVSSDIARAEMLSLPILLILLVFVFGSLVAALLPLAIGGLAILGAFTALKLLSIFTDLSIFSINIVTIMGLGLAIDYGLFIVSRFREELANGRDVQDAVVRTMATAGRTVAVSATTVAVALSGLLIFPQVFLRSMGMGGIAAVLVDAVGALTVLPALLLLLGRRVDAWSVRPLLRRVGMGRRDVTAEHHGFWYRLAMSVMRRPVLYIVAATALLLVLASPFLQATFGGVDARVLPASAESRQVSDTLIRDFPDNTSQPIQAVLSLDLPAASVQGQAAIGGYVQQARAVPGATSASVSAVRGDTAVVSVTYAGEALAGGARSVLASVRDLTPPAHVSDIHLGGATAQIVDRLHGLGQRLPWMALIIALSTFVLLFLAFGSIVLPIKAIVMNLLSLGASFGVVTWIFGNGHLSGFLDFTPTGSIDAAQPILVLAIVFGLSTDYEVFLLSRIREQYDLIGDNTQAVATGLQRSGRIITSAAMLLMVVIGAFSTSSITFIKLIGVAMFVGILIDATVVRSILVPATMRMLGTANWWAPGPLRRFYVRYGIRESGQPDDTQVVRPVARPGIPQVEQVD